jgi:hypothetical protein
MRRSAPLLLLAAVSVCCSIAVAPRARAERLELGIGSTSRFTHADSVLAVHDSRSTGFAMDVAYRWASIAGFDLLADASFDTDTAWATTFQRMYTASTTQVAQVGVRVRRPLAYAASAHARLALGATRVGLEIDDLDGRTHIADHGYGTSAYLGAGLDCVPLRPRFANGREAFSLGLRFELGYMAMTPVGFSAESPGPGMPEGTIEIPARAANLGNLDMSALTLRLALVARF